ncbi:bifunctional heptose 7-phosphate kinase/heptose 1-phosphate adenyltransferase [Sporomusa acidovorans]|uniref:Bifunctional protein HldE n=1 Tax=Sporomusa acidovorans (strain ATCC 49682 / DSM 3132 / Mol) TaxID=1123286 RepID=A0ABZ3J7U5_SPOA4|nr:PfkB family carbohydrate kinase [Sporomusa acidovorans]OZC19319.1 bifunctional protein HldE [Sporomusa acidovorans DSM 3132]SDD80934.1 rfaE bifunctional protein, domain I [Sporomusa acidovorans]
MSQNLSRLIDNLQQKKIMVIGDMVADVYLEGAISRISREAPVLILEHAGETVVPGGAANAVHNAATLGGQVYAVGVVGNDQAGQQLAQLLGDKQVNTQGFITDPSRPTITKTRVMAGGQATVRQQVVRIDRECKEALNATVEQRLLQYITEHIRQMDVVVMSDYGSSTISPAVRQVVIDACNQAGIPSMVDSRYNIMDYKGIKFVKQNESEAAAALKIRIRDQNSLNQAGRQLCEQLQAEGVLITQGPEGMTLFERAGAISHIPVSNKSEVYDVTGAGDTVAITMMLALAAGATVYEAACLANFAAGVVVRKPGTATATPAELKQALGDITYEHC